jgi:nitrogen fixation NifU-like protein
MVTELARGKSVAEALRLTSGDVLDALGGLPEGNVHCARQAVAALRAALRDYLDVRKEPWKRAYRRL